MRYTLFAHPSSAEARERCVTTFIGRPLANFSEIQQSFLK